MVKYIAILDFKAATGKGFEFFDLSSKKLLEAMAEAESLKTDSVYRLSIAEKAGKMARFENEKRTTYKEVLALRSCGWHPCNTAHCEDSSTWERADYGTFLDWKLKLD